MFKNVEYIAHYEAEELDPLPNEIIISITDFSPANLYKWSQLPPTKVGGL